MDKENKELDDYHFHEAIDRVEMIREITDNSLQSHAVISSIPRLKDLSDKVQDALGLLQGEVLVERDKIAQR